MFDTSINLTLQRNDMTCNNILKSLNTVKSRYFFFKERSEEKGFNKILSSLRILSLDLFIDSELLC